jgi:PAS domain S-box-containing protein
VDGTLQRMTGTAMDITERKVAAEALSRSEAQLAEAQQIAHVGSWELDLGSQQLSWSAEHCRIYGVDPGDDSRAFVDGLRYIHAEDRVALAAVFNGAISERGSYTSDVRIVRPDGAVRLIRNHGAFVTGDNAESARMVGTAQDITERVDSDRHQAKQASHINSLLASTSEGIYGIAPDGRCSFINAAGAAALGYTPEELIGRPMHAQVHHTHADGTPYAIETCPLYETLRSGVACHLERDVLWRRDGTPLVVEFEANPVIEDERLAGIVVTFRDVSARTQTEVSLRESELRLRLALEIAGLGTWDWNLERDEFVSSGVVERMLALEPGGLGKSPSDFWAFVHEDDRPALTRAVADALEREVEFRAEFRVRRVDGVVRWISTSGQIFRDRAGRPVRMLSVTRDVTESKPADAQRKTFQPGAKLRAVRR